MYQGDADIFRVSILRRLRLGTRQIGAGQDAHALLPPQRACRRLAATALRHVEPQEEAARWLAERENAADFVGGLTLDGKDHQLKSVLLDLSQSASLETSMEVADSVLTALRKIGPLHFNRIQQAGFMVLKSPDIPSLLVETAFISNPDEERMLRNSADQEKFAVALLGGISRYFSANPHLASIG